MYETMPGSKRCSIISINFENGSYELIGDFYEICFNYRFEHINRLPMKGFYVVIKFQCRQYNWFVQIFEIDNSLSNINSYQKANSSEDSILFNLFGKEIMFVDFHSHCSCNSFYSTGNFTLIKENNSFVEIENTGVDVKMERLDWKYDTVYMFYSL